MTTQKNGTAIPTNGKATAADVKPAATLAVVKPEKKEEKKQEANSGDMLPLEDRLLKINRLFDIQSKYNRLESSLATLNEFELKKEGETIKLEISDDNTRNRFSTRNPEVIREILAEVREIITRKKKALEPQLNW